MKVYFLIFLSFLGISCSNNFHKSVSTNQFQIPKFQHILDSAQLKGTILIYDFRQKKYYSNNFKSAKVGKIPASTFKIPNSIIALETGIVQSDSTWLKWDGIERDISVWNQDLRLRDAFHFSCVPCYQEVARKIGTKRMTEFIGKLNYGTIKLDANSIDIFWLRGKSQITPFQQIDFLRRLYTQELPISKRTFELMKSIMVIQQSEDWILSGKTGSSTQNQVNNGWFVGYAELKGKVYFFATNIEPTSKFDMKYFFTSRKTVTFEAFKQIGIYGLSN